jgi:tricorn protease
MQSILRAAAAALLAILVAIAPQPAPAATDGYYRFPSLHGETIVFTAEGDLWTVAAGGGTAKRLTTHPALETQARISPDGRQVAFVASYDGQPDVYVMPIGGGEPKRLTFEGPRVILSGWTPDGRVAYASDNAVGPSWRFMPRLVDPATLQTEELPLADANEIAVAADGTVYFTRFGLHVTGDNARRYRGGAMAELWQWRPGEPEATRIAPAHGANLMRPMVGEVGLVALSDLDGAYNLAAVDPASGEVRVLTRHAGFEVRSPAIDGHRVVYQHGADLRILDLATGDDRTVPIRLASDFEQRRERFIRNPLNFVTGVTLAPDGSRVAIAARGRAATAGLGPVRRIDLAAPPDARVREAHLSLDGRTVHAIVDADGRSEIVALPADGSPGGRALTRDGSVHRWRLHPSPDGTQIAHEDKKGRLFVLDLDSGRDRLIDESPYAGDAPRDGLAWSADGRHLAFARPDSTARRSQIIVVELASGRRATLTSDRYESYAPAFSPDGQWLYFLSDRNFQPTPGSPWGDRNMGPMFDRRTRIYALALDPAARFPFQPRNELSPARDDAEGAERGGGGEGDGERPRGRRAERPTPARVTAIAWEGLAGRLHEVPVDPGNYSQLATDGERLYVLDRAAAPDARPQLIALPIGDDPGRPKTVADNLAGYALSADRKRLLVIRAGGRGPDAAPIGDLLIVPAGDRLPEDLAKATVRLGDFQFPVDPGAEWRQMFDEAWRMHRAFSFDPAMRGVDWDAVRARYAPLVARIAERSELDDLLAQMVGEIGLLHSQIRPGELRPDPDAPAPAWLGARLEAAEGGVRIARIYRTDPELPGERAPLAQPGVDARDGDLIVAVNGRPVGTPGDVLAAIRTRAGQQVLLTLRRGPATPHRTIVVPIPTERDQALRYADWVQQVRARVEAAGRGRIGYLHLRAMGPPDVASFAREFHANVEREGLIVDVRRNRGGNIDSWILNALMRRAWAFWQPPLGTPYWNMQQAFRGHVVVLADPLTYSDGETFAAGTRALGIGPVIGRRTAGAGIWLSDRNRLADGGAARIAEFGQFAIDGRWLIEGTGVMPDQTVDNLPVATARGGDAQLDAALAWLERRLAEDPVRPLRAEPIPPLGTNAHDGTPPPARPR